MEVPPRYKKNPNPLSKVPSFEEEKTVKRIVDKWMIKKHQEFVFPDDIHVYIIDLE